MVRRSLLLVVTLLAAPRVFAAESVTMYLDGIPGVDNKTGIDCASFELEAKGTAAGLVSTAGGRPSGRQFSPVKIVKRVDKTSLLLIQALNDPKIRIRGVRLVFSRPVKDRPETYFMVELSDVQVASVKQSLNLITAHEQPATEEITFTFRSVKWSTGSGPGESTTASLDKGA